MKESGDDDMTLKELGVGNSAIVRTVGGEGALRQHFLDMGIIPGAHISVVSTPPWETMELIVRARPCPAAGGRCADQWNP